MSQSDAVVFGKNHRNQNQVDPAVSTSNLAQSKVEYSKLFDVFLSPLSNDWYCSDQHGAASMNSLESNESVVVRRSRKYVSAEQCLEPRVVNVQSEAQPIALRSGGRRVPSINNVRNAVAGEQPIVQTSSHPVLSSICLRTFSSCFL